MAEERKCCRCVHCERDPGSNWGWYCNYRRTHVKPNDYCGNYLPMYRY